MSELGELTALLHAKTAQGKVTWRFDSESRIHTFIGNNILEVARFDDIEESIITVTLRNKDGIILVQEEWGRAAKPFSQLEAIMTSVRRQSLRVDEALTELRSQLEAL